MYRINEVTKAKARYLQQSVRVTGLGTQAFENDMASINKVHAMMSSHLDKENIKIRPWQSELYEGHCAMDASTRYFTQQKYVPMEAGLPFDIGVDPMGVLAQLRGGDFIHGLDNKVDYLRGKKSKDQEDLRSVHYNRPNIQ